jgi:hypothetical protein
VHYPNHVFPLAILNGEEDYGLLAKVVEPFVAEKTNLKTKGIEIYKIKHILALKVFTQSHPTQLLVIFFYLPKY